MSLSLQELQAAGSSRSPGWVKKIVKTWRVGVKSVGSDRQLVCKVNNFFFLIFSWPENTNVESSN